MKDRIELVEEQLLRENIRKIIKVARKNRADQETLEETTLRSVIRGLIQEKVAINDEIPHEKTGINKLRRTLKKIIPQIRDDYLTLTTDPAQRKSYISHLINGIDNGYDSLTTVNVLKHHMWLNGKPLNYDPKNSPNTQDLPDIYKLTYSISIIERNAMLEHKNIVGNSPHFYEIDDVEGVDVDNQIDFDFAEFLYKRLKSEKSN